uniref:Uncharacterized protein n=1 Tax=Chenopodium quinoa TaxID=63459 RepID=A0A803LQJ2_CHEQI
MDATTTDPTASFGRMFRDTHCGAGSLSKAMVEVEWQDDDGYFTKEAVDKTVTTVMDFESEVGKEVRAAKRREFLLKEGLEDNYISSFIQSFQGVRG